MLASSFSNNFLSQASCGFAQTKLPASLPITFQEASNSLNLGYTLFKTYMLMNIDQVLQLAGLKAKF